MNNLYKAKESIWWNLLWYLIIATGGVGLLFLGVFLAVDTMRIISVEWGDWIIWAAAAFVALCSVAWVFITSSIIVPKCNQYLKFNGFRLEIKERQHNENCKAD